jgi:3-oxoadipate enol-lactonase
MNDATHADDGLPDGPEQTADIRGATLAYDVQGHGPDVVWGHGLSFSRATEVALPLLEWSQIEARVLHYDARGHGLSTTTPDLAGYRWSELALDQLALADHVGMERYIVAGASMGCGTAVHVAVTAPDRVRGLVLVIPPTAWETRTAQAAQWGEAAAAIAEQGVEALIETRAANPPPDPFAEDPGWYDRTAAATRTWEPQRLAVVLEGAAGADFPTREEIARITAPTLILAWTGDPVHPVATSDELGELIPHAELVTISTADELTGWTKRVADFIGGLA